MSCVLREPLVTNIFHNKFSQQGNCGKRVRRCDKADVGDYDDDHDGSHSRKLPCSCKSGVLPWRQSSVVSGLSLFTISFPDPQTGLQRRSPNQNSYLTFNTLSLKFQATEGKIAFSSQAHPCQEFTLKNDSSLRCDKKTVTGSGPTQANWSNKDKMCYLSASKAA